MFVYRIVSVLSFYQFLMFRIRYSKKAWFLAWRKHIQEEIWNENEEKKYDNSENKLNQMTFLKTKPVFDQNK